jgi:DNA-binding NtrC family response regulator
MIVLFAQNQFPTDQVARALLWEGFKTAHYQFERSLRELTLPQDLDKAVLIAQTPGIVGIGERTSEARSLLGDKAHLLVCAPSLAEVERRALNESGADTIVVPRTSSVEHVSERITAELILQENGNLTSFGPLYGATKVMRGLYSEIEMLAGLNDSILILGETGTGKELIAREIHRRSKRPEPFLKLNCAEFSPELLRSELFGHAKGAFTGAHQEKAGLMAEAGKGTLFLDEIGEMDIHAQAMLLQVLEDREFRPVGLNKIQKFNARLVLATHRNLEQMVEQGKFRRDLYARIYDFKLEAPPLRDRRADIPILVRHFLDRFNKEYPDRVARIRPEGVDCLFHSEWPENVRQLLKVVRKAAVYKGQDDYISVALLQNEINIISRQKALGARNSASFDPASDKFHDAIRNMQMAYLTAVLDQANGNKEAAIEMSGLGRSRFYELLKKLEIR